MTCSIEDCGKTARARGLCGTHYARWQRLGQTELTPYVTPTCSADGCGVLSSSNGLCSLHDQRMRRFGRTDLLVRPSLTHRLAAASVPSEDGCLIWQGRPGKNGYGRISVNNRVFYVHRVSYETHVGPIPEGLTIDHLCRIRMCIEPTHLEPVTLAENTRRELAVRYAGAGA
jgi:hypothetical protein